jgi:hypothetical protein
MPHAEFADNLKDSKQEEWASSSQVCLVWRFFTAKSLKNTIKIAVKRPFYAKTY